MASPSLYPHAHLGAGAILEAKSANRRIGYRPRERAPSMSFSTSLAVRYSRGRRFAFKSRRGGTVPFTVFGAALRFLLFAADIRVFTKGTVP